MIQENDIKAMETLGSFLRHYNAAVNFVDRNEKLPINASGVDKEILTTISALQIVVEKLCIEIVELRDRINKE